MGRTLTEVKNKGDFLEYNYDEYKEQAVKMAEKMGESAKLMKDKALDWFNQFTSQQS